MYMYIYVGMFCFSFMLFIFYELTAKSSEHNTFEKLPECLLKQNTSLKSTSIYMY